MRYWLIGLVIASLTACASTSPSDTSNGATSSVTSTSSADRRFSRLADAAWEYFREQQRAPDDALLDISPEALSQRHERLQDYYTQIDAVDSNKLSEQNRINRDMIMYGLKNAIDQYKYGARYIPLTNEYGFHSRVASLPNQVRLRRPEDYQNYLAKLRTVPAYFNQQIAYMREGLELGITQPAVVLDGITESVLTYVTIDPRDSVFYQPVADAQGRFSDEQFEQLDMEAQTIIATLVNPAYQDFYDFMRNEYIPETRENIAANSLPDGDAFYANRALHYTTLDLTPSEIHQIGLDEVARIRTEMMAIIEELEFDGSFAEFIEFLRTDDQFYATSAEELLKQAAYISKRADAALPQLFKQLPRTPYGVAPVPDEIAPTYTTGRYLRSNADDQPGYYWVNTYGLERRPLYELEALTLHEAVPGHHLQIALAQELDQLPDYRRNIYISAFGEGWGLYAEYLGIEAGFYQDPYSDFGRLTYEMWRAARLVVDTGMHTMGWSRERAVDFLASNTALSMHNVNTEIDRYIAWPGQALSYKLGELTIKRLRGEAEDALGDDFDVREFHYHILKNGSVPLHTLEQQIRNYIADAR